MKFEEEFPSFKEDARWCPSPIYSIIEKSNNCAYWSEGAIKEHCLDKQRVKEAIENSMTNIVNIYYKGYKETIPYTVMQAMKEQIMKELNLECLQGGTR